MDWAAVVSSRPRRKPPSWPPSYPSQSVRMPTFPPAELPRPPTEPASRPRSVYPWAAANAAVEPAASMSLSAAGSTGAACSVVAPYPAGMSTWTRYVWPAAGMNCNRYDPSEPVNVLAPTAPVPSTTFTNTPATPGSPGSWAPLPFRSLHTRSPTLAMDDDPLPEMLVLPDPLPDPPPDPAPASSM